MRVVFMGTPGFAVPSLLALAATHEVVAVYARPDAASGRGREPKAPPVKEAAAGLGLQIRQPESLRDPDTVAALRAIHPDVICVAAYGLILPQDVLDIPPHGCINVHASLLPRWRGAAPVQRAILAGDETTGVSIMRMEPGLDTGPVAATAETPTQGHTTETLTSLLALLGARTLIDVLDDVEAGRVEWRPQDESRATYAEKVTRRDVALSPDLSVDDAWRRVRASGHTAPCRAVVGGIPLTVQRAEPIPLDVPAGEILVTKRSLVLGFADGALALEEVTPQGRRTMDGASFARGARLESNAMWEAVPEETT